MFDDSAGSTNGCRLNRQCFETFQWGPMVKVGRKNKRSAHVRFSALFMFLDLLRRSDLTPSPLTRRASLSQTCAPTRASETFSQSLCLCCKSKRANERLVLHSRRTLCAKFTKSAQLDNGSNRNPFAANSTRHIILVIVRTMILPLPPFSNTWP